MRIIVTGSRSWRDRDAIHTALDEIAKQALRAGDPEIVVVHGCEPGAQVLADGWVTSRRGLLPVRVERHPPDRAKYGRRAWFVASFRMVQAGADVCLSFMFRGTNQRADLAEEHGIRTVRYTLRTVEPMADVVGES